MQFMLFTTALNILQILCHYMSKVQKICTNIFAFILFQLQSSKHLLCWNLDYLWILHHG